MYFKQYYLGCLAHASYLIASEGTGAVIDPQRDVDQYLEDAKAEGIEIKYIIETHLHADFVSGHKELAEKTGAQIVFGQSANYKDEHIRAKDGDKITFGNLELTFMETPGHTPESICVLVKDKSDEASPAQLFTGDTLFIGDVGRPDLVGSKGYTEEDMASKMYDSLHNKILKLDDDTRVHPAHGAGSLCGKKLSDERSSTIGLQKQFNYALKEKDREKFIELLTADQPEVPAYFPKDAEMNRKGAIAVESIPMPEAISAEETQKLLKEGAVLLDTRKGMVYACGHIKGALNIGLTGQFASWCGTLIPIGTPVVLITNDSESIKEAVVRLARVGIESAVGYLENGVMDWRSAGFEVSQNEAITVNKLKAKIEEGEKLQIVDVRRPAEFANGHAPNAINIPLAELTERVDELPDLPLAVICQSGYRSSIAISLLEKAGKNKLMNIIGGTKAWIDSEFEVEGQPLTCAS